MDGFELAGFAAAVIAEEDIDTMTGR
jgi:hypothetical protein